MITPAMSGLVMWGSSSKPQPTSKTTHMFLCYQGLQVRLLCTWDPDGFPWPCCQGVRRSLQDCPFSWSISANQTEQWRITSKILFTVIDGFLLVFCRRWLSFVVAFCQKQDQRRLSLRLVKWQHAPISGIDPFFSACCHFTRRRDIEPSNAAMSPIFKNEHDFHSPMVHGK